MRPIETLEHPERTADLYLLDEQRPLGISWPVRRQPLGEVLAEALKIQVHAFDRALLHVEDVVDGDAVDPRLESAAEVELRQSRDRSNHDVLRGILRILTIPQHAESQTVDVALQGSDETIERLPVPVDGLPCKIFQRFGHLDHCSMSDFSVVSSDCSSTRCASRAPSTCSSATGGACSTKL